MGSGNHIGVRGLIERASVRFVPSRLRYQSGIAIDDYAWTIANEMIPACDRKTPAASEEQGCLRHIVDGDCLTFWGVAGPGVAVGGWRQSASLTHPRSGLTSPRVNH